MALMLLTTQKALCMCHVSFTSRSYRECVEGWRSLNNSCVRWQGTEHWWLYRASCPSKSSSINHTDALLYILRRAVFRGQHAQLHQRCFILLSKANAMFSLFNSLQNWWCYRKEAIGYRSQGILIGYMKIFIKSLKSVLILWFSSKQLPDTIQVWYR